MSVSPDTLPDLLAAGLKVVSIGLNPSPISTQTGVYFANPRNRFWPAMRAAKLIPPEMEASPQTMRYLVEECGIGFTDVVKRTTPGASALRAADFRRDAPRLLDQLRELRPAAAWFHGKVAYEGFRRYALGDHKPVEWGWQPALSGDWPPETRVLVTPNPSPANASYSLADLTRWYRLIKPLI